MAISALQAAGFIRSDGETAFGLTPVGDNQREVQALSIDEQAALHDAKSFDHIDFVFFRRFSDGRSSQIAAYVVDNSNEKHDETVLAKLHLQVWLHGTVPLLYVFSPTKIEVLSCARGPDFWENDQCKYNPAKTIPTVSIHNAAQITEEMRQYSAFRLADGTFWEDPDTSYLFNYKKAAHQSLIEAVVETDNELDGANNPVMRRLLLVMILVKYLEDRGVFPNQNWFGRFRPGARSFFDVLSGGEPDETFRLLDFLEQRFNGDVFALPGEGKKKLTKTKLRQFADLVESKTLKRQRYLWEQYSFQHLPVEVLSHLYQRFVQGGHGAVYTPRLLATLLLDHAMPYEKLTGKEKILDPACGSGIFLVGALRRLVNVWRSKNGWKKPDVKTLKAIVARSIYGVELDSFAIDLTAFSLSLAVCDALKPDVIWNELKFDRLRDSNLSGTDFFGEVLKAEDGNKSLLDGKFDVVIGNPPFEPKLTDAGNRVDQNEQLRDGNRGKVPGRQTAYLFLEQALKFVRNGGVTCLIQPSGFLYNKNTETFRKAIFHSNEVTTLFDFCSIRKLYEADPKTVAVLIRNREATRDHKIAHWTFRRTKSVHERICFELDHYDRHQIPQQLAETNAHVWRTNLLGGGRLLDVSQRLRSMRSLADFIRDKGWEYGEGFIAAKSEPRTQAQFLTGLPLLPTDALTVDGIDEDRIGIVTETRFRSPYTKARYTSPLLLIKERATLPLAFWDSGPLAYQHEIVGLHAPRSQVSVLKTLSDTLSNNIDFFRFSCTLNGTRALVGRATAILKQDIDNLPYPENFADVSFSFWEQALCEDINDYIADYIRLGQNSKLLTEIANTKDLRGYAEMFIRLLGSVYDELHASDPIFLQGLTCQPFYFGKRPDFSWISETVEHDLNKLIYDDNNYEALRTTRILRYYDKNFILLVKPDRLRYWIRSTAIRDADETLVDLRHQGF